MNPFDFEHAIEEQFRICIREPDRRPSQIWRDPCYAAFLDLLGPSDRACIVAVHRMKEQEQ